MRNVYIVGACRTPIGSFGGSLKPLSAARLGALCIQESLRRSRIPKEEINEVLLGNVLQGGKGQNPARQAAIYAGIPNEITATTLNEVCGSGLKTITLASQIIRSGEAECILAGGMESMSNAGHILDGYRFGSKMGDGALVDLMIKDGLWDVYNDYHMGITAENVAEKYGVTREEQDRFAASSQQKAAAAQEAGRFKDEIFPVEIPQRKGDPVLFDTDEYIKKDASYEKMAALRPAFKPEGTVTAANASGINDGACTMLLVSEEFLKKHSLTPLAKIVRGVGVGCDPSVMGIAPIGAVQQLLRLTGLSIADIDLFEANEAFAAQAFPVGRELSIPAEKLNVNGGAIALGHPIGASGARILTTLLYEMRRRGAKRGLATLCIGGGMAEALIIEL